MKLKLSDLGFSELNLIAVNEGRTARADDVLVMANVADHMLPELQDYLRELLWAKMHGRTAYMPENFLNRKQAGIKFINPFKRHNQVAFDDTNKTWALTSANFCQSRFTKHTVFYDHEGLPLDTSALTKAGCLLRGIIPPGMENYTVDSGLLDRILRSPIQTMLVYEGNSIDLQVALAYKNLVLHNSNWSFVFHLVPQFFDRFRRVGDPAVPHHFSFPYMDLVGNIETATVMRIMKPMGFTVIADDTRQELRIFAASKDIKEFWISYF